MSRGGGNGGRMVYITTRLAADCLSDFRDGGSAGADAPEEQGEYVKEA